MKCGSILRHHGQSWFTSWPQMSSQCGMPWWWRSSEKLRDACGASTMYLWIGVSDGETSEAHAERLLQHGIVVAPGSYLGPSGEGYVRYALVPTEDECRQAVAMLDDAL